MNSTIRSRRREVVDRRPLVLITDDDNEYVERTAAALSSAYRTTCASSGEAVVDKIREEIPAIVLLDQRLQGRVSGLTALGDIKAKFPDVPVIMVSAYLDDDVIQGAMERGAEGWLTKKVAPDVLLKTIEREIKKALYSRKLEILERRDKEDSVTPVFESPVMRQVRERLELIKDLPETILFTGPTGTGKSVLARWVHETSVFAERPFEAVTLPAFSSTLIESELFGHEKDSFNQAVERIGWLEKVGNGTIVFEEIGDLPVESQVKLLGAVETRTISRVGSSQPIKLNLRIIACTNIDLEEAIERGTFRRDLFARLKRHRIELPALDDRPEDIPTLAAQFVAAFSRKCKKQVSGIDPEAVRYLQTCHWPENMRSLEDLIGNCVLYAKDPTLSLEDIARSHERGDAPPKRPVGASKFVPGLSYEEARLEWEKSFIEDVLRLTQGNVTEAASRMGTRREVLSRKIKRLGIDSSRFRPG